MQIDMDMTNDIFSKLLQLHIIMFSAYGALWQTP